MIRKHDQYTQAVHLRKRGFTYGEIAKTVDVSKSTVSKWFSGNAWSQMVAQSNAKRAANENSKRISLLNTARSNQYKKMYAEAERTAGTEYRHYRSNPLFTAALMLYYTKGDMKHDGRVRLTTSNIEAHRIFIRFVNEFLGVPRKNIRFWLLLYSVHDPRSCSKHWSVKTGLSLTQFHKYQVVPNKSTKEALRFGVGNTIIGDTLMKRKLIKWIELCIEEL